MSPANVEYVLRHNPEVKKRDGVQRRKYGIPLDKKVFVYGGNLDKPQAGHSVFNRMRMPEESEGFTGSLFLDVGNGTEYKLLEDYATKAKQANFKLMKSLPKDDYDTLVAACDMGMIFLDHRFTIPNFPSRLLG